MSRKFSWHRSRYYSSEGLEVVPAEGIEVGFPKELKPLPEPPKKSPPFYNKGMSAVIKHKNIVAQKFKTMGRFKEGTGNTDTGDEEDRPQQSKGRWWRQKLLGVQILWIMVGIIIFVSGVGFGGWMASMIVAGRKGGQVIVPGTAGSGLQSPSAALSSSVSSEFTSSSSTLTESTSRSFTSSIRRISTSSTSHTIMASTTRLLPSKVESVGFIVTAS